MDISQIDSHGLSSAFHGSIFNHLLNIWTLHFAWDHLTRTSIPDLLENTDTVSIPGVFRVDQVKQLGDILVQLEPLTFDQRRQRPLSVTGEDEGRYDL